MGDPMSCRPGGGKCLSTHGHCQLYHCYSSAHRGEWGVSCGTRQRKDIDLPSFLLHVLDSTGFGESEEISSWGKGELENKVRVQEQLRMDICGWVSQAAAE